MLLKEGQDKVSWLTEMPGRAPRRIDACNSSGGGGGVLVTLLWVVAAVVLVAPLVCMPWVIAVRMIVTAACKPLLW